MSELEKRELQFNSVLERGESLVRHNHPAIKAIEAHLAAMNAQWAWLLQLTHCLETHLQNTRIYQDFFKDVLTAEEWLREYELKNMIHGQNLTIIWQISGKMRS